MTFNGSDVASTTRALLLKKAAGLTAAAAVAAAPFKVAVLFEEESLLE